MSALRGVADPGALSLRMSVLEPTITPDQMGGSTFAYAVTRKLWGRYEPEKPDQHTSAPVDDRLARGQVLVRIGEAPAASARLSWAQAGVTRTFQIEAVEPGMTAFPFDRCVVREVDQDGGS